MKYRFIYFYFYLLYFLIIIIFLHLSCLVCTPMLNVNELPFIITENIFKYVLNANSLAENKWDTSLNLLSVCREWRALGMPMVYRTAFVYSKDTTSEGSLDRSWLNTIMVDRTVLSTNIDLVYATDASHFVKELALDILNPSHMNSLICSMVAMLNKNPRFWSNISELRIRVNLEDPNRQPGNIEAEQAQFRFQSTKIMFFMRSIAPYMPNVKSIAFHCRNQDMVAQVFCGKLVEAYSSQLCSLQCMNAVEIRTPILSTNITRLWLTANRDRSRILPQVCSRSLKHLNLCNMTFAFSWKYFQSQDNIGDIVFPQLSVLEISFDLNAEHNNESDCSQWRQQSGNEDQFKVMFPALKTYEVHNHFENTDICAGDVYPQHLKSLSFKNSYKSLEILETCGIQSVDTLSVHIPTLETSFEDTFYKTTNYLFGKMENASKTNLYFGEMEFQLSPSLVNWTNITSLTFYSEVGIDIVFGLISHVPRMRALTVHMISTDAAPVAPSVGLARKPTLRKRKMGLKTLNILGIKDGSQTEALANRVKNLMVETPSLKTISSGIGIEKSLKWFIQKNKIDYPHLKSVKVRK